MRLHSDDTTRSAHSSSFSPRQLDLTGVDPVIASQLARIAAAARRPRAVARLRRALAGVAIPVARRTGRWRPMRQPEDELWSNSNIALLALAAAAAASLALALSPLPGGDVTGQAPFAAVASPSAITGANPIAPNDDASHAKAARDRARAARYHSEKSDSKTYAAAIHLAAARKEMEGDVALDAGKYALAIELYDLARDGYDLARTRSRRSAAELDRSRIEEQLVADARRSARNGGPIRPQFVFDAPEECAVAHAVGLGIAAGACGRERRDAEMAAITRCQDKVLARYGNGTTTTTCSLASGLG